MEIWYVLLIIAVLSIVVAIIVSKIAKWHGSSESISSFLLVLGLLLTPTILVIGTFKDNLKVQIITLSVFLLLLIVAFIRLYKADHPKANDHSEMNCIYCGSMIRQNMRYCPSCGRMIKPEQKNSRIRPYK